MQTELEMAVSAVVADWSGARYVNGSNETLEDYMTKARVESNMNTADYNLKEFELNTENGVVVGYKDKDYNFTVEITSSGNSAKVIYEGNSEGSSGGSGSDEEEEPPIEIDYEYGDVESYGDYVDYPIDLNGDGNTTNDWRIFYNNGTNIFIIAAEYVKSDSEYLDLATAEIYASSNSNPDDIYSLSWNNNGVTFNTHAGGNSVIDAEIANLFMYNNYYNKYLSSVYINVRATASLLDTLAWDGFVDNSGLADYAIGGPTLEMWVASYNAKGYLPLYTNINDSGYYIGNSEGTTSLLYELENNENTGYNDTLYVPYQGKINNCQGYWLASPSAGDYTSIMCVSCVTPGISGNLYNNSVGVRPVVSLKTDTIATYNGNGVWILSND